MCAICGIVYFERDRNVDADVVRSMMTCMQHRGPDDEGMYLNGCVALGHRRLSIIDLQTGKQPISNEDGKVWIVFNGEIYNYADLRSDLQIRGHLFRTKTDTEVIIHAYEEYGEDCLLRFRGMFAFAIWDAKKRKLFLARDRIGIKPLYYCVTGESFIFASEMKAILCNETVRREVDPRIIDRFLTYYYVPGEKTLIKGIYKVPTGHYLTFKDGRLEKKQYWDLEFPEEQKLLDLEKAKGHLMELLRETIRLHMISDVPVGILLSGGVDSSALLSLCVSETNKRISTFTIGFEEAGFDDERIFARLAAERYGTRHYETSMTAEQFQDFLPYYVWHMEEPVCEPPAVALYYVAKMACSHVKVLLSGEGGDEAFAGYPNHRNMLLLEQMKKKLNWLAIPLSRGLIYFAELLHMRRVKRYAKLLTIPQDKYYLSRTSSPYSTFNHDYEKLYTDDFLSKIDKNDSMSPTRDLFNKIKYDDPLHRMLYIDTKTWLPDDLLIKADKITMATSVELRVPLLDHVLLEYAARIPSNLKIRNLKTKYILKNMFENIVPKEILRKKKTGFPVPYEKWLREDLRNYVEGILLSKKAIQRGYFKKETVESMIYGGQNEHLSKEIFSLLILELWHRSFIG